MTMDIIVIMWLLLIIFHLTALHGEDFVLVLDDGSYDLDCFQICLQELLLPNNSYFR
jgi:hypothetical protein